MLQSLQNNRKKIDFIDQKILKLIKKRLNIVKKIGKIKKKNNLPIFSIHREKEIQKKIKKICKNYNISFKLIQNIFSELTKESYIQETQEGFKTHLSKKKKIFIIGNSIHIGKIFYQMYKLSRYKINLIKFKEIQKYKKKIINSDVVFLNISNLIIHNTIDKIPLLKKKCILVDLSKFKYNSIKILLQKQICAILGLSISFTSYTNVNFVKKIVIHCKGRGKKKYQWILNQIQQWGACIYHIHAKQYDQNKLLFDQIKNFFIKKYYKFFIQKKINIDLFLSILSSKELSLIALLNDMTYKNIILKNKKLLIYQKKFFQKISKNILFIKQNYQK